MFNLNPRRYLRPTTLQEAVEQAAHPGALALAGGALTLNQLALPFETLVDLQAVNDLSRIENHDRGLFLGGAARLQTVVESPLTPDLLKQSVLRTITRSQRSGASVGESLLAGKTLPEWLAALTALEASVETAVPYLPVCPADCNQNTLAL